MLSIIVPIYNIEKYVRKCIDTLISQHGQDIEIILVDDGSTDNCSNICDEYAQRDQRIRVIHKKNGGLVAARISGLEVATGNYVMFVDGDDWLEESFYDTVSKLLDKEFDLICFGAIYIYSKGRAFVPVSAPAGSYNYQRIKKLIYPKLIENEYGKYFDSSIWGKVFRKELLKECYIGMSTDITMGEDGAITRPYMLRCNSIYIMDEFFYCYNRLNQASMTRALKPIKWSNPWLIRKILINNFGYDSEWRYQINRNTVHNLFITSISQFNSSKSYWDVAKDIRMNLRGSEIKQICKNTRYSKFFNKAAVFVIRYKIAAALYLYWRIKK